MDPLTQGLIGSSLAASFVKKTKVRVAVVCGALGGMAPDLDTLIRSSSDPLLYTEYHRHFTHSLAFVPIGGLIVASLLWLVFFRKTQSFKLVYLFTTLGYFTHGLLDAATSYGTRLLWPFSDERVSWNIVSIVDPIYTGILLLAVLIGLWGKSAKVILLGLFLSLSCLAFGIYKHHQVAEIVEVLAESRGHEIDRLLLNPTIGNNVLWRSVYQSGDEYYVDAVRVGNFSDPQILEGTKTQVLDIDAIYPTLKADSTVRKDIARFDFFSQGFIYKHPDYDNVIADLRYGTLPNDLYSMWGIRVDASKPNEHVDWVSLRSIEQRHFDKLKGMVLEGFASR